MSASGEQERAQEQKVNGEQDQFILFVIGRCQKLWTAPNRHSLYLSCKNNITKFLTLNQDNEKHNNKKHKKNFFIICPIMSKNANMSNILVLVLVSGWFLLLVIYPLLFTSRSKQRGIFNQNFK